MKNLKHKYLLLLLLAGSVVLFAGWGAGGHRIINYNTYYSFAFQIPQFQQWASTLRAHASDADNRKDTDPTESPKHYIDIDLYNEFLVHHRIPQTFDSVVSIHGYNFVMNNGILPWATIAAFDTLRNCFHRGDWSKAVLIASDLGHYIGDGHMPLHITGNYNGQSTGNTGIHSRYESTMINQFLSQITYSGDTLRYISDVNNYVFSYIYSNYIYKDSILLADTYAKGQASGSTTSATYINALWAKTKDFTIMLFKNASHSLAELIYTAWIDAGSPEWGMASVNDIKPQLVSDVQAFPNPSAESVFLNYSLWVAADVSLTVFDNYGKIVSIIQNGYQTPGVYSLEWKNTGVPAGIYIYAFKVGNSMKSGKIVVNY